MCAQPCGVRPDRLSGLRLPALSAAAAANTPVSWLTRCSHGAEVPIRRVTQAAPVSLSALPRGLHHVQQTCTHVQPHVYTCRYGCSHAEQSHLLLTQHSPAPCAHRVYVCVHLPSAGLQLVTVLHSLTGVSSHVHRSQLQLPPPSLSGSQRERDHNTLHHVAQAADGEVGEGLHTKHHHAHADVSR
jgi:hypothetical protein